MPTLRTKSVPKLWPLGENSHCKGQTGAMAPATSETAAMDTTANYKCNNPNPDLELHTNQTQHLEKLAMPAKKKNNFQSDYHKKCGNSPTVKVQELDDNGNEYVKTVECTNK